jgi:hypothetical protein
VFDVARILANQPAFEIADYSHSRFVGPARVRLADAVDALISLHFDEDEIPASDADKVGFDVGYFDCGPVTDSSGRLQHWRRRTRQRCTHHARSHQKFSAFHETSWPVHDITRMTKPES